MEEILQTLFNVINNKKVDLAQYENKQNANKFYIDKENSNILKLNYLSELIEINHKKNELTKDKYRQQNKLLKEHIDKLEIVCLLFGISDFNEWVNFNNKEDLIRKLKDLNKIRRRCFTPIDLRQKNLRVSKGVSDFLNEQIKKGNIKNVKK